MIATKKGPYNASGIWNYPELPDGMRQATPADFSVLISHCEERSDEAIVFGINILHKPDALKDYQARNISTAAELEKWKPEILAGRVFVDKLPYKFYGLWYYPRYPLGCRRAVMSDFLNIDNEIKPGIDFLVLGTISPEYEAHRTSTYERFSNWMSWVQVGRVFIKAK